MDQYLITPTTDMASGRPAYQVWEYDLERPRNLNSADPRRRFAVKGLLGCFSGMSDAVAEVRRLSLPREGEQG